MVINELWIQNDLEGSDGGLILDTIPAFVWRDRGKPRKPQSG
jgi:hypothetical protein